MSTNTLSHPLKDYSLVEHYSRHGGPYDRGSADAYYGRGFDPHYFEFDTYSSVLVPPELMTEEEIAAYKSGYDSTVAAGDFKDWG
jgi:hypothetical protein